MVKEIRLITQSHIPNNGDDLDGIKAGYTYPPYAFKLEQYNGKLSIECYKNGEWTHTVKSADEDRLEVELQFTKLIEAYVEEVLANAPPEPTTFKGKIKRFFQYYLTRKNIRDILGM